MSVAMVNSPGWGNEIADLLKEGAVRPRIERLALAGQMPCVDLLLQGLPLRQERPIQRPQLIESGLKTRPKGIAIHARARQHAFIHQLVQFRGHLQATASHPCRHRSSLIARLRWKSELV